MLRMCRHGTGGAWRVYRRGVMDVWRHEALEQRLQGGDLKVWSYGAMERWRSGGMVYA